MFGVFLIFALVHTTEYISQLSRMFCSRLCKPPLEGQIFGKVSFYNKFTSFLKLKRTDFQSKFFDRCYYNETEVLLISPIGSMWKSGAVVSTDT